MALFGASQKCILQYYFASGFVFKTVIPGATPQLILETTPVSNLNRARACSLKCKTFFKHVSLHFSIYLQHQVATLVNKCTVYNAQFFQHHIKYMVLAPEWSMRWLLILFLRKYEPIQAIPSSKKVAHSGLSQRVKQLMTIGNAQYSHLQPFHLQSRKLESCTWAEDLTHVSSLPLPMPGVGGTQAELNSD